MYERFTDRARAVLQQANVVAYFFNHEYIGTQHILLALYEEGSGVAANALRNLFVDLTKLYEEVEKIAQRGAYFSSRSKRPQTPRVKLVIANAIEEAELLDANYVGTEHLLLALVRQTEGVAAQALMNLGLKAEEIRGEVLRILGREIPVEKRSNVPPRPGAGQVSAQAGSGIPKEKSAMYERFTDRARKVMQLANQEAQRFNHEYIGTEHILLGLIKEGAGVAANVLKNLDIDLRKLRMEVEKIVLRGPDVVIVGKLPQTPRAKKVIEYAIEEARSLNHKYIGTEHLLLGLLREEDTVAAQILLNLGLKLDDVRDEILLMLGQTPAREGWEHRRQERFEDRVCEKKCGENRKIQWKEDPIPSADSERIRSLEQQLWNLRVLLGAFVGATAGALLLAQFGAILGLLVGGLVAALGRRTLGVLAGAPAGALLGYTHLFDEGAGLACAFLGAVMGFLIADIGSRSNKSS
ncbi:MAG TPA: Clp protease N-terminal domain-containing protein [Gemmataceae bacterium]|nr:Clp protease N-terminal domain-containing protein [Gemmataceae bacterium]